MGKPMRKVAIVGGATTKMKPRHTVRCQAMIIKYFPLYQL